MEIILGFILLIVLIGFIASKKFGGLAESKGYPSKKAKMYPWLIAGAAIFFNVLGQTLMTFISRDMLTILFVCWGCFVILAMLAILKMAYKNMQAAPDAKVKANKKTNALSNNPN